MDGPIYFLTTSNPHGTVVTHMERKKNGTETHMELSCRGGIVIFAPEAYLRPANLGRLRPWVSLPYTEGFVGRRAWTFGNCSAQTAMSMLRVCTNWCLSTSLRQPLHGTSVGHGAAAWKSRTKLVRRLCVRSLSVQDEGNAVEALAKDLALKVQW